MKHKVIYFALAIVTIISGLLVRLWRSCFPEWINLWLGDALYAIMMYWVVALFSTYSHPKHKAAVALAVCFCIELLQLYQAAWINTIRATLPGKLILGSGFLWSDLVAYTVGIAAAFCVDILYFRPSKTPA